MTKKEIRATVLRILGDIAPEADLQCIKPDVTFRDQFDIDSMDFLNFVIALDQELHLAIPESDYPKLCSLDLSVEFLTSLRDAQPAKMDSVESTYDAARPRRV
jgi:acyl carrier protein